jgi:hypothetical protein
VIFFFFSGERIFSLVNLVYLDNVNVRAPVLESILKIKDYCSKHKEGFLPLFLQYDRFGFEGAGSEKITADSYSKATRCSVLEVVLVANRPNKIKKRKQKQKKKKGPYLSIITEYMKARGISSANHCGVYK